MPIPELDEPFSPKPVPVDRVHDLLKKMEPTKLQRFRDSLEELEVAMAARQNESLCERETIYQVARSRDKTYDLLESLFPSVQVSRCEVCLKVGKHAAKDCVLAKPLCVRCGVEGNHAPETCSTACLHCNQIDKDATHTDCPVYRREFVRQIFCQSFNLRDDVVQKIMGRTKCLREFLVDTMKLDPDEVARITMTPSDTSASPQAL